jgi:hypothetical protein
MGTGGDSRKQHSTNAFTAAGAAARGADILAAGSLCPSICAVGRYFMFRVLKCFVRLFFGLGNATTSAQSA